MAESVEYIQPFSGNFNVFLSLLHNHQASLPNGPNLTDDQIVYVAGVLSEFIRHEYSVGGMRITTPNDLAMPDVLEHLFHHHADAELAGGFLLASMGTITTPRTDNTYDRSRAVYYDMIARSCFRVAEAASNLPGHKMIMSSMHAEYPEIRKEISRFTRALNSRRFHHGPS